MNIYSGVKRDRRIRNTTNSKFLSKSCKSDPCLNLLENKLSKKIAGLLKMNLQKQTLSCYDTSSSCFSRLMYIRQTIGSVFVLFCFPGLLECQQSLLLTGPRDSLTKKLKMGKLYELEKQFCYSVVNLNFNSGPFVYGFYLQQPLYKGEISNSLRLPSRHFPEPREITSSAN